MRPAPLTLLAALVVAPAALVAFLGQSGSLCWPGELCSHWTLHAALLLVLGSVVWRRHHALSRGCIILLLVALIPWLRQAYAERAPATALPLLHLGWANLYRYNGHHAEALAALLGRDDDLLGLTEVVPGDRELVEQDGRWPHQAWTPGDSLFACALLSKRRLVSQDIRDCAGHQLIDAVADAGEGPLRILVTHLTAPLSYADWQTRDRQLALLAQFANRQDLPTVLLGDLNATPAAALWRPFLALSGLQSAPGPTPATWPAWSSPWPRCPGIAIDHILARQGCLTPLTAFSVPGSDHLGLAAGWAPLRAAP